MLLVSFAGSAAGLGAVEPALASGSPGVAATPETCAPDTEFELIEPTKMTSSLLVATPESLAHQSLSATAGETVRSHDERQDHEPRTA
ncbi:hypothetical protein CCU68_07120 [Pseudomonas gingeri NCPPB 3146 = LMG 5327]|uniref:Uncharacterized protein n=1 Tax=Pseudomonas gingeri NCPPB 3146 = LMG 5327 TaxID=707248 RepID=A0ABX4Y8K0_9PSED|nr:hypothetical protein CCU68_07120 [Pseudomonas gingeri NCPPB 3146 = LMG 5327]